MSIQLVGLDRTAKETQYPARAHADVVTYSYFVTSGFTVRNAFDIDGTRKELAVMQTANMGGVHEVVHDHRRPGAPHEVLCNTKPRRVAFQLGNRRYIALT